MTSLEDKLRAAIYAAAEEIPATPPPLRLTARGLTARRRPGFIRLGRRGWSTWTAPLAAAALVVAVILASLAVTGGLSGRGTSAPQTGRAGVPPYYVALTGVTPYPDEYGTAATQAQVRATATGAVLATVVPPKPYVSFTGVTAAADDRTFVLVAQEASHPPATMQQDAREYPYGGYEPVTRFFILRMAPDSKTSARASLSALPDGFIPVGFTVHDMALSPDGASLAADVGGVLDHIQLYVFNLATGTSRAWGAKTCSGCFPSSGGLGFGGVNVDALSWTADGQHIAFVWGSTVRLLATAEPGTNLLANSKRVAGFTVPSHMVGNWRGAIITPDGRTVLGVEELFSQGSGTTLREKLVRFSAATGQVTADLNNLNVFKYRGYEQVLYTNATGSVLIVSFLRPGLSVGILHGGSYTPLPWNLHTQTAAW
jgi:hypothetical protein